jgi:hypothetical protein
MKLTWQVSKTRCITNYAKIGLGQRSNSKRLFSLQNWGLWILLPHGGLFSIRLTFASKLFAALHRKIIQLDQLVPF